jgi:hypothetical protein
VSLPHFSAPHLRHQDNRLAKSVAPDPSNTCLVPLQNNLNSAMLAG